MDVNIIWINNLIGRQQWYGEQYVIIDYWIDFTIQQNQTDNYIYKKVGNGFLNVMLSPMIFICL
jgi:hypothetical protein